MEYLQAIVNARRALHALNRAGYAVEIGDDNKTVYVADPVASWDGARWVTEFKIVILSVYPDLSAIYRFLDIRS